MRTGFNRCIQISTDTYRFQQMASYK
jgi:hypothetical protein